MADRNDNLGGTGSDRGSQSGQGGFGNQGGQGGSRGSENIGDESNVNRDRDRSQTGTPGKREEGGYGSPSQTPDSDRINNPQSDDENESDDNTSRR